MSRRRMLGLMAFIAGWCGAILMKLYGMPGVIGNGVVVAGIVVGAWFAVDEGKA